MVELLIFTHVVLDLVSSYVGNARENKASTRRVRGGDCGTVPNGYWPRPPTQKPQPSGGSPLYFLVTSIN